MSRADRSSRVLAIIHNYIIALRWRQGFVEPDRHWGSPTSTDSLRISKVIASFGCILDGCYNSFSPFVHGSLFISPYVECMELALAFPTSSKHAVVGYTIFFVAHSVGLGRYPSKRPHGLHVDHFGCMKLEVAWSAWSYMERPIGFLESAVSWGYHALLGKWVACSKGFVGSKDAKQESLSNI